MTCPRCDGLLSEDHTFAADMAFYQFPQRRFVCSAGHSVITGAPALATIQRPQTMHAPTRTVAHTCLWCGEPFEGITQQKFCSEPCRRAVDTERTAQRNARDASRLDGEALRRARAWTVRRPSGPVAYAPRPRNLSMRWA